MQTAFKVTQLPYTIDQCPWARVSNNQELILNKLSLIHITMLLIESIISKHSKCSKSRILFILTALHSLPLSSQSLLPISYHIIRAHRQINGFVFLVVCNLDINQLIILDLHKF